MKKRSFSQMTPKRQAGPAPRHDRCRRASGPPRPDPRSQNRQPCNTVQFCKLPAEAYSVVSGPRLSTLSLPGDRGLTVDRGPIHYHHNLHNAWTGPHGRPIADWRFGSRKAPYKRTRYSARKLLDTHSTQNAPQAEIVPGARFRFYRVAPSSGRSLLKTSLIDWLWRFFS